MPQKTMIWIQPVKGTSPLCSTRNDPKTTQSTKNPANLRGPPFFWVSELSAGNVNFQLDQLLNSTNSLTKGGEAIWHIGELDLLGRPHVKCWSKFQYPNQEMFNLSSIPLSKVSKMDFENEDVLANVASIFENDCTVSWGWSVFLYKVKVWKSTAPRAGAPGQACLPKYRAARRKVAREAEVLRQDDLAKAQCHNKRHESWLDNRKLMASQNTDAFTPALSFPIVLPHIKEIFIGTFPKKTKQLTKSQVKLQLDSRVTSWPHRFFQLFTARKQPMAANIATRPFFSSDSRRRRKVFKSPSCRIPSIKRSTKPTDQAETRGHC